MPTATACAGTSRVTTAPAPMIALSPTHAVDMKAFDERKAAAFECHRTQFKDRERFLRMLEIRKGREYFHLAVDRSGAP